MEQRKGDHARKLLVCVLWVHDAKSEAGRLAAASAEGNDLRGGSLLKIRHGAFEVANVAACGVGGMPGRRRFGFKQTGAFAAQPYRQVGVDYHASSVAAFRAAVVEAIGHGNRSATGRAHCQKIVG